MFWTRVAIINGFATVVPRHAGSPTPVTSFVIRRITELDQGGTCMYNASRGIRSVLAVAVLATGAGWLAMSPASAENCDEKVVLLDETTVAEVCEEVGGLRAKTTRTPMRASQESELAMSAERLAKAAGMPGLSRSTAVLSVSDMGGVAAGAGLPSLPSGVPGQAGLQEVSKLALAPDLPGLPSLPPLPPLPNAEALDEVSTLGEAARLAEVSELGEAAVPEMAMPDAAGVTGGSTLLDLTPPVNEVATKVGELMEQPGGKAQPDAKGLRLPVADGDGLAGLTERLDLG